MSIASLTSIVRAPDSLWSLGKKASVRSTLPLSQDSGSIRAQRGRRLAPRAPSVLSANDALQPHLSHIRVQPLYSLEPMTGKHGAWPLQTASLESFRPSSPPWHKDLEPKSSEDEAQQLERAKLASLRLSSQPWHRELKPQSPEDEAWQLELAKLASLESLGPSSQPWRKVQPKSPEHEAWQLKIATLASLETRRPASQPRRTELKSSSPGHEAWQSIGQREYLQASKPYTVSAGPASMQSQLTKPRGNGWVDAQGIYRERQDDAFRCGMHALNSVLVALGRSPISKADYDATMKEQNTSDKELSSSGDFRLSSSEDLQYLARQRGLDPRVISLQAPGSLEAGNVKKSPGMLVLCGAHWVALVKGNDQRWYVTDSLAPETLRSYAGDGREAYQAFHRDQHSPPTDIVAF